MAIKDINGTPVDESNLPTVRLDQLRAGNNAESKKLLEACRIHGFFYLDLTSDPKLCNDWEELLAIMKQYFNQPLDIKMQDARGSDNTGYEPSGTEVGPKAGTRDGYESVKFSRREFLNKELELTTPLKDHTEFIFDFIEQAHGCTMMMLEKLSDEMGRKGDDRFEVFHSDAKPSLSNLAVLMYPKHNEAEPDKVGHNKHTDIGSLTFLLPKQWGLQILSTQTGQWEFVTPRPGHAVINVGDSLHFPSERKLVSVVHRVIPLHEKQEEDRYSIAYFLRVNDDLRWTDANGNAWSAKEWHDFKFDAFRSPDAMENGMSILTGEMEDNDVLRNHVTQNTFVAA
ncbi:hypothetical protein BKA66DRAFT_536042 [Pyrenochaeta sp. MPI-SDFR-AT-0127]|nr:hypothetical protein BKA66DRAFT_536042 [Pyrenochaeta sp. MPI-SDFR-AT-0127]